MDVLETDFWALQLPDEWFAEQDDETIIISDESEVSTIELTSILADKNISKDDILADVLPDNAIKTVLAEETAYYHELSEDGVFWREWVCELAEGVLLISHGMDEDNKGMDDASVDEILSTLAIALPESEQQEIE
ncbi:MAG: hypothetical protein KAG18_03525 [Sinobacterium sp.]|nr:hypothetical protein [Sinobacterium sp.]